MHAASRVGPYHWHIRSVLFYFMFSCLPRIPFPFELVSHCSVAVIITIAALFPTLTSSILPEYIRAELSFPHTPCATLLAWQAQVRNTLELNSPNPLATKSPPIVLILVRPRLSGSRPPQEGPA
ncbi:hypothetical protein EDB83DRAFT_2418892 [Lactarius deliciosus]|nr:hypothetical protein EDB83DRAFT_2418892 [Lactarius deliciosus]